MKTVALVYFVCLIVVVNCLWGNKDWRGKYRAFPGAPKAGKTYSGRLY